MNKIEENNEVVEFLKNRKRIEAVSRWQRYYMDMQYVRTYSIFYNNW